MTPAELIISTNSTSDDGVHVRHISGVFWVTARHLSSRHKRNDDISGMAIEIGPATVVDRRDPRVLMAGGELDIPERNAGIESGHDESGTQHVRVDDPEARPLANGADPAMCSPAVEAAPILSTQDRPLAALTDCEVDGPSRPRDERNDRRLVAFANDAQRPMASLHPEVLHVGGTGLAHPEAVRAQENGEGRMRAVDPLGGEEEGAELSTIHAPHLVGEDPRPTYVLSRVRTDAGRRCARSDRTHRPSRAVDQ